VKLAYQFETTLKTWRLKHVNEFLEITIDKSVVDVNLVDMPLFG